MSKIKSKKNESKILKRPYACDRLQVGFVFVLPVFVFFFFLFFFLWSSRGTSVFKFSVGWMRRRNRIIIIIIIRQK